MYTIPKVNTDNDSNKNGIQIHIDIWYNQRTAYIN